MGCVEGTIHHSFGQLSHQPVDLKQIKFPPLPKTVQVTRQDLIIFLITFYHLNGKKVRRFSSKMFYNDKF